MRTLSTALLALTAFVSAPAAAANLAEWGGTGMPPFFGHTSHTKEDWASGRPVELDTNLPFDAQLTYNQGLARTTLHREMAGRNVSRIVMTCDASADASSSQLNVHFLFDKKDKYAYLAHSQPFECAEGYLASIQAHYKSGAYFFRSDAISSELLAFLADKMKPILKQGTFHQEKSPAQVQKLTRVVITNPYEHFIRIYMAEQRSNRDRSKQVKVSPDGTATVLGQPGLLLRAELTKDLHMAFMSQRKRNTPEELELRCLAKSDGTSVAVLYATAKYGGPAVRGRWPYKCEEGLLISGRRWWRHTARQTDDLFAISVSTKLSQEVARYWLVERIHPKLFGDDVTEMRNVSHDVTDMRHLKF